MLKLYIGNKNYSSWSLRPWLLMQELGIEFTEELKPFITGGSWSDFRKFSPSGTVPLLVDGDTKVWDSLSIAEYLAEDYSHVWPEDKIARAWARSITAEMHSGFSALRNQCNMSVGQRIKLHTVTAELEKDVQRIDEIWSEGLQRFGGDFLAGDKFTAADAFFAPVAYRVRTFSLNMSDEAIAYANRLLALSSMKSWETAALKEPWREPSHEKEATDAGEVLEDFRTS
jgi:glutathione S-transferase